MFSTPFSFMASAAAPPGPPVVQCFTSNGTWSCCTGTTCVEVVAIGAGGGGGGGVVSFGGTNAPACVAAGQGGGGAGGVSICTICSGFGTTQCVIVGVGGAGGAQGSGAVTTAGGAGGVSCFGALVCAGGGFGPSSYSGNSPAATLQRSGAGGVGNQGTSPAGGTNGNFTNPECFGGFKSCGGFAVGKPGGGGGADGLASGGTTSKPGCNGGAGSTICGITLGAGGRAGRTAIGCCAIVGLVGQDKTNGQCFGAGGGGGGGGCNTGAGAGNANYTGGAGFQGIIQVTQFFT